MKGDTKIKEMLSSEHWRKGHRRDEGKEGKVRGGVKRDAKEER